MSEEKGVADAADCDDRLTEDKALTILDSYTALPWPYKRLYSAIRELRPSMAERVVEIDRLARSMDHAALGALVESAESVIASAFDLIGDAVEAWLAEQSPDTAYGICNAYLLAYLQANYWYVLLDGIYLEGAYEAYGVDLLNRVGEATGIPVISILAGDLDRSGAALSSASRQAPSVDVSGALSFHPEMKEEFSRFRVLYEVTKRWQAMFSELSRRTFETNLLPLRRAVFEVGSIVGVDLEHVDVFALPRAVQDLVMPEVLRLRASDRVWATLPK